MPRRSDKIDAEALNVVDGIGERRAFPFAGIARTGIHLSDRKAPSEPQTYGLFKPAPDLPDLFFDRRWKLLGHNACPENLTQYTYHGNLVRNREWRQHEVVLQKAPETRRVLTRNAVCGLFVKPFIINHAPNRTG